MHKGWRAGGPTDLQRRIQTWACSGFMLMLCPWRSGKSAPGPQPCFCPKEAGLCRVGMADNSWFVLAGCKLKLVGHVVGVTYIIRPLPLLQKQ